MDLVQWTDLILFDYLTANFDRLVSNLFSLQWDPRAAHWSHQQPAPRPRRGAGLSGQRGGLVHGYRVAGMWDKYRAAAAVLVRVPRADGAARPGATPRPGRGRPAAAPTSTTSLLPELAAPADPYAQPLLQRRLDFLAEAHFAL